VINHPLVPDKVTYKLVLRKVGSLEKLCNEDQMHWENEYISKKVVYIMGNNIYTHPESFGIIKQWFKEENK